MGWGGVGWGGVLRTRIGGRGERDGMRKGGEQVWEKGWCGLGGFGMEMPDREWRVRVAGFRSGEGGGPRRTVGLGGGWCVGGRGVGPSLATSVRQGRGAGDRCVGSRVGKWRGRRKEEVGGLWVRCGGVGRGRGVGK